jgi:hypothetical protein
MTTPGYGEKGSEFALPMFFSNRIIRYIKIKARPTLAEYIPRYCAI